MAVRDWRLNGTNPLAYMGVNAGSPPNIKEYDRNPTTDDSKNVIIGDFWFNTTSSPQELWILASLELRIATWISLGSGLCADSFPTDSGTAIPLAGVLNILSGTGTLTSGSGNTVTVYADGDVATTYNADTGNAKATVNILNVLGGTGIDTTGAAATLTIDADASVATSYDTDAGTAVAALNVLTVAGGTNCSTSGAGSTVTIDVTAGGLINAGENLNEAPAGTINLNETIHWPNTNAAGTTGVIYLGGAGGTGGIRFMHNYGGTESTFVGERAGNFTTTGITNTGFGEGVLDDLTTGSNNTGCGQGSLADCNTGFANAGFGNGANFRVTTGDQNTALGTAALDHVTTGSDNIGIGWKGGEEYTLGDSNNIAIGHKGLTAENNTIRVGTHGAGAAQQNKCFLAGTRGITTGVADAIPVLIDSAHQLGTASSSRRYKQNIQDMDTESDDLMKLRPVTFEYKKHPGNRQYGLIAEEVEEVMPRLVVKDEEGIPETVKYHVLQSILLHAIQKLVARVDDLEKKLLA